MVKNILNLISFCICFLIIGCASQINPAILESEIQRARESISSARKAQSEEYSGRYLNKAEQLLKEAEGFQKEGENDIAWETAFQSELQAKIAEADARKAIAEERIKKAKSEQITALLGKMEHSLKAAEARQKIAEVKANAAQERAQKAEEDAAKARQYANKVERDAEKTILENNATLKVSKAELVLQVAFDAGAEEFAANEYKNASQLIAEAKSLIGKGNFDEAEQKAKRAEEIASRAITGAKTAKAAIEKRQTQAYIDTKSAIAKAQFVFNSAKRNNAAEHATQEFEKAKIMLEQANNAVEQENFEQALRLAAQSEAHATRARDIAQVKEKKKIEEENRELMIAQTKDAIFKAQEAVNFASSETIQLAPNLCEKAQKALQDAKKAMQEKDYEMASALAQKSSTYINDAKQKAEKISQNESKIIDAASKIPKVQVEQTERGVLIRFSGDIYASGSSTLNKDCYPRLKELAEVLKQYSEYDVLIEGHTDSIGEADVNLKLSNSRAYNFFQHLIEKHGIPEKRLKPIGYGESKPIASNRTSNGREKNRRIDVVILTRS